jgi:hypothetical protein
MNKCILTMLLVGLAASLAISDDVMTPRNASIGENIFLRDANGRLYSTSYPVPVALVSSGSLSLTIKDGNQALQVSDPNNWTLNLARNATLTTMRQDANQMNAILLNLQSYESSIYLDANNMDVNLTAMRAQQFTPVDGNRIETLLLANTAAVNAVKAVALDSNYPTADANLPYGQTITDVPINRSTTGYKLLKAAGGTGKVHRLIGAGLTVDTDAGKISILTSSPDPNLLTTDPNLTFGTPLLPLHWTNAGGVVLSPQLQPAATWASGEANCPLWLRVIDANACGMVKVGTK